MPGTSLGSGAASVPAVALMGVEVGDVSVSASSEETPVTGVPSVNAWWIVLGAGRPGDFSLSGTLSGDFSRSDTSGGTGVLFPIFCATTASMSLLVFQSPSWPNQEAGWSRSGPSHLLSSQVRRPLFGAPALTPLCSSFGGVDPFLRGRHDFNITNNVRLSP